MGLLVIDVGTSGVRAALVTPDGAVRCERFERCLPATPAPGLVELDPIQIAELALELSHQVIAEGGAAEAVGIANQRASTIVWDRASGEPVGPGIGWQDLRTVGSCLELQAEGIRLAPNQSATKLAQLLDAADPERSRDLCFGTVDSWIAWRLSEGRLHVTDQSNAAVTGLLTADGALWHQGVLEALRIPESSLPTVVDSAGVVGEATALPGAPPIAGIAGDQQASLIGQGCVQPGLAKLTFGTGAMLDLWLGSQRPGFAERGPGGTFPIVTMRREGVTSWGLEAIMLSAGSNVEWLCDDLGIISSPAQSHDLAASCQSSGGVIYVPALLGLGTPRWDYGARSALFGITRGTTGAEIARAVLEGVAQRAADLVEAAELDSGMEIGSLRVDGGMSANPTFVQAVANATRRTVELAPVTEATTLGAAFLAALGIGAISDLGELADLWAPRALVGVTKPLDRDRWAEAVERAAAWHPELSALGF